MLRAALYTFRSQRLLYCQNWLQSWGQVFSDVNPSGSTDWRKLCWSVWVKDVACNFYAIKAYLNFLLLLGGFYGDVFIITQILRVSSHLIRLFNWFWTLYSCVAFLVGQWSPYVLINDWVTQRGYKHSQIHYSLILFSELWLNFLTLYS